jgi:hypothetical protein
MKELQEVVKGEAVMVGKEKCEESGLCPVLPRFAPPLTPALLEMPSGNTDSVKISQQP